MAFKPQRWLYWLIAFVSLLLGLIGVFLPVLPTTPFIILAMWAASKCSPRLAAWIESHPQLGPMIHSWQQNRAIPLFAKCLATIMMSLSLFILWYRGYGPWFLGIMLLIIGLLLAYIWSKPHR
ncbi:MAG: YbaN family protein [Xanthomonadales bacterium]|nr:YbaN family protein [Xanthomonadales bacterium]